MVIFNIIPQKCISKATAFAKQLSFLIICSNKLRYFASNLSKHPRSLTLHENV